jgi:hypothetical protein
VVSSIQPRQGHLCRSWIASSIMDCMAETLRSCLLPMSFHMLFLVPLMSVSSISDMALSRIWFRDGSAVLDPVGSALCVHFAEHDTGCSPQRTDCCCHGQRDFGCSDRRFALLASSPYQSWGAWANDLAAHALTNK